MGFFDLPDREPEDDELDVEDEEDGFDGLRHAAWIAGVVPLELVVARSDQAAVAVSRISAYPDGFELTMNSDLHRSVKRTRRNHLHHPMMLHDLGEPGEPLPDALLRFGLTWPDGGRATNLDGWGRSWPDATDRPTVLNRRAEAAQTASTPRSTGPGPFRAPAHWDLFSNGLRSASVRPPRPSMAR